MGVYDIQKWKVFRKIVAISGIIQGFTWLVMGAICIGMYFGQAFGSVKELYALQVISETKYIDLISFAFYDSFLNITNNYEKRLLKPQNLQIFVWLYVFLSIFWISISVGECLTIFRRGSRKYEAHVLMLSGAITIVICILDILLMCLAFYDFSKLNIFDYEDYFDLNSSSESSLENFQDVIDQIYRYKVGRKVAFGILATISARGFILWIFNCVAGILLLLISIKVFQSPPILLYDNKSIPRPKIKLGLTKSSDGSRRSFGGVFAEESSNYYTTPRSEEKRHSLPNRGRYGGESSRHNPLALNNKPGRHENIFY